MHSVYKNNFIAGILSALLVGLYLIIDSRRKNEPIDKMNLFKTTVVVFIIVTLIVYVLKYLHTFNKQLGGSSDFEIDTGLPHF